jgi:hypothetical protein
VPKAITDDDVKLIAEMIRHWPKEEQLTWKNICLGSQSILGYKPSRQALDKKTTISIAYHAKKTQIRLQINKLSSVARPRSMLDAMERIADLEAENDQLKGEIQKMSEIARRFIYNASVKGFTREQLMKPLPEKKQ